MFVKHCALREQWRTHLDLNHAFLTYLGRRSGSQEKSAVVVLLILQKRPQTSIVFSKVWVRFKEGGEEAVWKLNNANKVC